MTHCSETHAENLLNLYVDGELASSEEADLFAHLSTCAACRTQFNTLFAFRLAARQENLDVPPAADEAFFARIDQLRRVSRPAPDRVTDRRQLTVVRRKRFAYASVAAVALFVAAFGWSVRTSTIVEPAAPAYQVTETVIDDGALYVISPGLTVEDEKLAQ
ncbi:MAG: zf-HC2 domain-containing protein [Rubricoccaceae bacterium]|nr:zf-HC2 domain-containing protein [Rubricoccaceae bacterium]